MQQACHKLVASLQKLVRYPTENIDMGLHELLEVVIRQTMFELLEVVTESGRLKFILMKAFYDMTVCFRKTKMKCRP